MMELNKLIRKNILALKPYSSARDEFYGDIGIFLDANENPYGTLNRYPDPYQRKLKAVLSEQKGVAPDSIFIGNGSDEIIDLLFRMFCNPGQDKALTFSPTYGMYDVSASINDVELLKIELNAQFQIDLDSLPPYLNDSSLKLILLCTPNNPTSNCINPETIEAILKTFCGIVLVDEAYIDFSEKPSYIEKLSEYPNLVVSQTLSKAYGLAAARIGIAYANPEIISFLNKVKPPYNISALNQQAAIDALLDKEKYESNSQLILTEKENLVQRLNLLPIVYRIYPSDTNFLLVETEDANLIYEQLVSMNIIVRNRNNVIRNCLRITIGTPEENQLLINALATIKL
ncbi:histidinol-phosphate aminotransferase [Ulvibacter sp. MAR_2010_11]|uniref:histidinol-phosphate transaminase n=1 Tax=Ulvibacter sp. MAR_2010_11 TaxID=1250229 RepID=UPI000C2CA71B|nr:histidinol-phosphate transaminase [Ulvibacter sp. MAR_2010_11]PKA84023.1 histidinol-phosphate aminotransferase [Ulvibacter sp. MAR_2010_11]